MTTTILHINIRGALDTEVSATVKLLPQDVGDVHDPGNGWQCWAVLRQSKETSAAFVHPRQCLSRRQGAKRKGEAQPYCCKSHAKWNAAAMALATKGKK